VLAATLPNTFDNRANPEESGNGTYVAQLNGVSNMTYKQDSTDAYPLHATLTPSASRLSVTFKEYIGSSKA